MMSTHLTGTVFKNADLSNVLLAGTLLHLADFENTNLTRANLQSASLLLLKFKGANFTDANLSFSKIVGVYLTSKKSSNTFKSLDLTLHGANFIDAHLDTGSKAYLQIYHKDVVIDL